MDKFPKFIVEDGCIIMYKVKYHMELATDEKKVKGGGWFFYSESQNAFIFNGDSTQFGKASVDDIKQCIKDNKVFTNKSKRNSIANQYNFLYDLGYDKIDLKK